MTDRLRIVTERAHVYRVTTLVIWRCPRCGRILAKLHLTVGSVVEIKCGVCNTVAVKEAA